MTHKAWSIAFVALLCIVGMATSTFAEPFADVYVGAGWGQDENVRVRIGGISDSSAGDFEGSVTAGVRLGYWFETPPWLGVALDASYMKPEADTEMFPISALLMLRWPLLVSTGFPKGRLQPYVGAGPGLFISRLDTDAGGFAKFSDTSYDLGLDVRAGAAWMFSKNIGLFAEYRFTHVSPEWEDTVFGQKTTVGADFNTHHLSVGVTFRF